MGSWKMLLLHGYVLGRSVGLLNEIRATSE